MEASLQGRNFLALEDFTPEEIMYLLDLSHEMKRECHEGIDQRRYHGKNLLMLFEMGSTRTRCAFETAGQDLGMGTTYLSNSHFGKKETIKDSMRVFSGMYRAIAYRGPSHAQLLEMVKDCTIPVINGYTNHQHPTQMLADAMTLQEIWGRDGLKGKTFCFIGRGGEVNSFSYAVMCAMLGMNFVYVTSFMDFEDALAQLTPAQREMYHRYVPEGTMPNHWESKMPAAKRAIVEDLYARYHPECSFIETDDLDAVKGVDAFATENWGFFTDPAPAWLPGIVRFRPYQVNRELLERTGNPDVVVLHMLPATHNADHEAGAELADIVAPDDPELADFLHKGFEVTDEVFEEQAHHIFREAENRQHTIRAVLRAVLG